MNYKNILIRLHQTFPQFETETLIQILNCIDEEYKTPTPIYISDPGIAWASDRILGDQLVCNAADTVKTNTHT